MTQRTIGPAALAAAIAVTALAQTPHAPMPQPVLLGGKPFPRVERYAAAVPAPRRTFFVAPGTAPGDGSEKNPWTDLQQALRALEPGDRLRVAKGTYRGGLAIDGRCRDGTRERPIQLFFDRDAALGPAAGGPALTIRRAHWHLSGPLLRLGDAEGGGIAVEASSVSIDGARISGGAGPGVRVGRGASNVTLSNCTISGRTLTRASTASAGVDIESGAAGIVLTNNRFLLHRAGSIRVRSARDVRLTANTIRDAGGTAILVEGASGLRIDGNTLFAAAGAETRGIELREAADAVVRGNQLTGFAAALSIGRVDPVVHAPRNVLVERNHLETAAAAGVALVVEAGSAIRFVNNVVNGYADALLLLGRRPSLAGVTVANNLVIGVSRTAFVLRDRAAAALFDFNVFSPGGDAVEVEVDGAAARLAEFLQRKTMPNTSMTRVVMFDHDLARLGGVETVDRGTPVAGLPFGGRAPDLGVAER